MDAQAVITLEAAWTSLMMIGTGAILLKRPKEALRDWGVICFCFAGGGIYLLIAIRWLLMLPIWVGALALGLKALFSTFLFVWVFMAARAHR